MNTFGVFQTYYASTILTHETESNIAWIGSIQAFLLLAATLITGPLCDLGYTRPQLIISSVVSVFGMMMTSICKEYWQFMLAQAVCMGLGFSGIFITAVTIPPSYFTTKRAFTLGICAAGSSLGKHLCRSYQTTCLHVPGGVIYPIIFHKLVPRIGFPWTVRVLAFIMLGTLLISIACMKVRVQTRRKRNFIDISAFTQHPKYAIYNVACFFGYAGLYIPFFYIQQYSTEIAHTSSELAFYTIPILSAASIFGRIGPGFIADKLGELNTLLVCALISTILVFCWIAVREIAGVVVFCILYGFFSGSFVSLQAATVARLVPNMSVIGTWMGQCTFITGLGLLVGTPVAGVILNSGWVGLQCFCGGCIAVSTLCILASCIAKA